ncbi:MAG: fimbrillin family protein [Bacteroidales bacterium]|nr:fimbrillin family protein [Bacteroidales bacterium]
MRKVVLLFAALFTLAGCSRSLEQPAKMKEGELFTWSTRAGTTATKTSLEGTTLSWVVGDRIGIFVGDIQENMPFVNTEGNYFDGSLVCRGESFYPINYYAYYPYVENAVPSTTVSAILPSEQTAPFDESANYMVANIVSAKYDESDMPLVTFDFNNQLMSIVKVTVTNSDAEYAAQELLGVSMEATGGQTLAGHFQFDITSPTSAPLFSTTPAEVFTTVSSTFPEASRPTLGLNVPHSLYLLVNPITVPALKLVVKTTDYAFVVTTSTSTVFEKGKVVSLPVIDVKGKAPQRRIRQCVLWGDSITSNAGYPTSAQGILGPDWEVIGAGIGGDSPLGIAGRQGGIPLCLNMGFTIPASNTDPAVKIGVPYSTKNSSNASSPSSLGATSAQRYVANAGGRINPCVIKFKDGDQDVEIEGSVAYNASGWWDFTRTTSGAQVDVPAGATFLSYGARAYKDADVIVIYMGANGGYSGINNGYTALAAFYQQMKDYTTQKKAVIMGFHMGYIKFPNESEKTYWTTEYRDIMQDTFGSNFLDLKSEMTKVTGGTEVPEEKYAAAYNLLIETGRYTIGQAMTAADIDALSKGYWPQSFASTSNYSDVHFNTYGAKAMAILVKRKMKELGYLDY